MKTTIKQMESMSALELFTHDRDKWYFYKLLKDVSNMQIPQATTRLVKKCSMVRRFIDKLYDLNMSGDYEAADRMEKEFIKKLFTY